MFRKYFPSWSTSLSAKIEINLAKELIECFMESHFINLRKVTLLNLIYELGKVNFIGILVELLVVLIKYIFYKFRLFRWILRKIY